MKSKLWTVDNVGTVLVFAVIGGGLVAGGWPNITKHARAFGERTGLVAKAPAPEPPVTAALQKAVTASDAAAKRHVDAVTKFFDQRAANAGRFAERALSLDSTGEYLAAFVGLADADAHERYLKRSFEATVFSPAEVNTLIERVLAEYRKDLEKVDFVFVGDLQLDLPDSALLSKELLAKLQSDGTFKDAYGRLLAGVAPALQKEIGAAAAGQLFNFYLGNLAADGLLAAGAAAGFSVGGWVPWLAANYIAGEVVSALLDWVMGKVKDLTGFDPKGDVEAAVRRTVSGLRDRILDGDPADATRYDALRKRLAQPFPSELAKAKTQAEFDAVVTKGNVGLARQFALMKQARAVVREQIAKQAAAKK